MKHVIKNIERPGFGQDHKKALPNLSARRLQSWQGANKSHQRILRLMVWWQLSRACR